MSVEQISPISQRSAKRLPSTGSASEVASALPFNVYKTNLNFLSGASDFVSYVYNELAGSIVDIELLPENVYSAYQFSCLEYSYILNIHNAKNNLNNVLGATTASFNSDGELLSGSTATTIGNKYVKFNIGYTSRVSDGIAKEVGFGRDMKEYTASLDLVNGQQVYDLQQILSTHPELSGTVGTNKVYIHKINYQSPHSNWRFFAGLFGNYNVVGNLTSYGQYSDDTTFEVIPTWQNKLQAMAFQDSLYTRTSHFGYEISNNKIRLFPTPYHGWYVKKLLVYFTVNTDPWVSDPNVNEGIDGISNLSNFPVDHIPFDSINQIGKQWIRKYALAICKSMLAQARGKLSTLPIPGGDVTLNWSSLESQAKEEKESLRKELMEILDKLTYAEMTKTKSEMLKDGFEILKNIPLPIYKK